MRDKKVRQPAERQSYSAAYGPYDHRFEADIKRIHDIADYPSPGLVPILAVESLQAVLHGSSAKKAEFVHHLIIYQALEGVKHSAVEVNPNLTCRLQKVIVPLSRD